MDEKHRLHYSKPKNGSGNKIFLKRDVRITQNKLDYTRIVEPSGPCSTTRGRNKESNFNRAGTNNAI